ncbi:hypothetical protein K2X85_10405 [bacterium]|nr:hypothetical protein [bacterium]
MSVVGYLWAFPCTLIGLLIGLLGLATGGRAQLVEGVVEFWGGLIAWLLRRVPLIGGAEAMTIGHVVLGQTFISLELTRRHEHVHVRQYERWGILFFIIYFGLMPWLWWKGAHPYFDHPFEVEAFREADQTDQGDFV